VSAMRSRATLMRSRSTTKAKAARPTLSKDELPSLDASLSRILANLEGLSIEGLCRQWRNHLGGEPPLHLPQWLLLGILGYRLQAAAFGGIDRATRGMIQGERETAAGAPFDRRDPQTREGVVLKVGALLVREWQGKLERVMVLEEGFAWNGKTFGSLSQIAKAMTGTSWNGHRFFGLRQGKEAAKGNNTNGHSG
jgi:Protein of unknown function (DUF2924)